MKSFQDKVDRWILECFGEKIGKDPVERNYRFLEEALELVQACDCTKEDAIKLVDYVFGRPKGELYQEIGGVMVTLAALCNAYNMQIDMCADMEINRIVQPEIIEKIRKKQVTKDIQSMNAQQYKPGDKVKIISLEKVRSYPEDPNGCFLIGNCVWVSDMNSLAGTFRSLVETGFDYYRIKNTNWYISPEMIEGPADEPDKIQEQILALKIHTAKIIASGPEGCRKYLASLELEFDDNPAEVEQEVESFPSEKKYTEEELKDAMERAFRDGACAEYPTDRDGLRRVTKGDFETWYQNTYLK